MKLASLFTETMGVNGIEILEFDNCAQEVKDRLSTAIRNLRDPDYETMVTANERDSRTKVLVKIKEDMIRELVIFTTGNDNALIRIKGKISPSDLDRVIKRQRRGIGDRSINDRLLAGKGTGRKGGYPAYTGTDRAAPREPEAGNPPAWY